MSEVEDTNHLLNHEILSKFSYSNSKILQKWSKIYQSSDKIQPRVI